ncbi:39S ribosomal protein L33-like protein [Dinothrombium tinctorium]|uniref:39S ribosomal protein L33-like protein n=1 Tax=Dinothrombium tinctorium TaxID=1965070 RepID=A0A3S4QU85_9ACAR|nr:39S ribosomal protein L33-like protein [Dinothrombium tinctorium]
MAKAKSKFILVQIQSLVSGHKAVVARPRVNDKLEVYRWDPWIQMMSVYKEVKKIASTKW